MIAFSVAAYRLCVNLPRWGLKQDVLASTQAEMLGVNLPRWGLKLHYERRIYLVFGCKFTPLGFETDKN